MMSVREPFSSPLRIADLRPTQMTVVVRGSRRSATLAYEKKKGFRFLGNHMIPVAFPDDRHDVIDHHHLAGRLCMTKCVEDIRVPGEKPQDPGPHSFWFLPGHHSWLHPLRLRRPPRITRICRRPCRAHLRSLRSLAATFDSPAVSPGTRAVHRIPCGRIFARRVSETVETPFEDAL